MVVGEREVVAPVEGSQSIPDTSNKSVFLSLPLSRRALMALQVQIQQEIVNKFIAALHHTGSNSEIHYNDKIEKKNYCERYIMQPVMSQSAAARPFRKVISIHITPPS